MFSAGLVARIATLTVGDHEIEDTSPNSRWVSKPFLDILREHILPRLRQVASSPASNVGDGRAPASAVGNAGDARQGAGNEGAEARCLQEAETAVALVCSDWATAHRQAEHDAVQVRLWDADQVRSLESSLRRRARVGTLRLQSPQPDLTGMMAAVSELLYGSAGGAGAEGAQGGAGDGGGGGGSSAMPRSLRVIESDGATAVPLLLLAAAELPHLETLSLAQLPASWTYQEGALPWPPHAQARLAQLLPKESQEAFADPKLHILLYGVPVYRRFKSYWSSFDGALAALLLLRGRQLRELALEAPARSVGRRVVELLAAQSPSNLTSLRLRSFGLRQEPHVPPRVPPERSGLLLAGALRSLADLAAMSAAAAAAGEQHTHPHRRPHQAQQQPQQQQQQDETQHQQPPYRYQYRSGGGGCVPVPLPVPLPCGGGLTRLELLSCGAEPLDAGVLEGLTGLRALSLRDSSFSWRDRPPDLRLLRRLRSLDLRRSDWLALDGTPWDEQLMLPASLESLDLVGFSSLTTVDLSPLEHLTALAELSDITLQPDPSERTDNQLQVPYSGLAALTCMLTLRQYVGGALPSHGRGGRRWDSDETHSDSDEDNGNGNGGSSSGSEAALWYEQWCQREQKQPIDHGNGGGSGGGGGDGAAVAAQTAAPLAAAPLTAPAPPLVSLTLYGVLPQYVSDLFSAMPLLTRLVFGGEAGSGDSRDNGDGGESEETGHLVLRAGELPRLRELDLGLGLLGYGQLVLGPATSLTKLTVDDVEYVDMRYIELPSSLRHLCITAWFGMPELYHLHEGPPLASAIARATGGRMERAARARDAGGAGSDSSGSGDWTGEGGIHVGEDSTKEITRALEVEVERQVVQRVLPPLRQLRVLQLNWDVVTRGPVSAPGGAAAAAAGSRAVESGGGGGNGGGAGRGGPARWPFPCLPLLEELIVPWMGELPDSDLVRVLGSCPSLRAVTHCYGSRRAVRWVDGSWLRRSAGGSEDVEGAGMEARRAA